MEEVIRKYFQCWLDKDIDAVKGIFSDDIIYSECYGPVYKGIGQIIRWFEEPERYCFAVGYKTCGCFWEYGCCGMVFPVRLRGQCGWL